MVIAFIGKENNTRNLLALSLSFYQLFAAKMLLFEGRFMKLGMEAAFSGEKSCYIKDASIAGMKEGMDYLIYRSRQGLLNPLVLREGLTYLAPDFAYVKAAVHGKRQKYINYFQLHYKKMRQLFEKRFDYVMVDCGGGQGQIEETIVRSSDVVVYNADLEEFMKKQQFPQWLYLHKPTFYLFDYTGAHEKELLVKAKNYYRMDLQQMAALPMDASFLSKMENGAVWNYGQRARYSRHNYWTEEFLRKSDKAAVLLMNFIEAQKPNVD